MSNKPLSIEVAEAIGWTDIKQGEYGKWFGTYAGSTLQVPAYDRSWCSLGPLISRYKITLLFEPDLYQAWDLDRILFEEDKDPVTAAARLIVTLKKEGKLPND